MDATIHRPTQTEGRKLVNRGPNLAPRSSGICESEASSSVGSRQVPVAEGYELWAPAYDHSPNPLLAREERYLLPLFGDLQHKRILDLACGTGRWLERLMVRGGKSGVGIDCSSAMLRVAAQKGRITGRLARAQCEHLPFRNGFFDLALCSFAAGHLGNLKSIALELARVTKSRADVFVSDLHPEAYARGWRVGFRDHGIALQIEMRPREIEEIIEVFCTSGFECVAQDSLYLGAPEESIFLRGGKSKSFADACKVPAILLCHLRRLR